MSRNIANFNRRSKPEPGTTTMVCIQRAIDAIVSKPIIPGHYNAALGVHIHASDPGPGVENLSRKERARRKARITLAKVW